jgi:membrane protein implicated in regulation of membrane protease activity
VLLEVTTLPGIGLLFAGLAAIVVGGLVSVHVIDGSAILLQFSVFFVSTGIWAALLWVPMKRLRYKNSAANYKHLVGNLGVVIGAPLTKHSFGQVKWSGTILKARITPHGNVDEIPVGTEVEIVEIDGATVYVKPHGNDNT